MLDRQESIEIKNESVRKKKVGVVTDDYRVCVYGERVRYYNRKK